MVTKKTTNEGAATEGASIEKKARKTASRKTNVGTLRKPRAPRKKDGKPKDGDQQQLAASALPIQETMQSEVTGQPGNSQVENQQAENLQTENRQEENLQIETPQAELIQPAEYVENADLTKPATVEVKPTMEEIESVTEEAESVTEVVKLAKEDVKPIKEDLKPISEDTKPAAVEPKPAVKPQATIPPLPEMQIENIVDLAQAPQRNIILSDQQIQQLTLDEIEERHAYLQEMLTRVLDYDVIISDTNIWLELLLASNHNDPRGNARLQFERQLEFISKLSKRRGARFMMMGETYEEIDRFATMQDPQNHKEADFTDNLVCLNAAARLAKRLILTQQRENRLRIEGIAAESHHASFADPAIIRRVVELFADGRKVLLITNDASVAIRSMGLCDDLQRINDISDDEWDQLYAPLRPMVFTFDDLRLLDNYTRQYHYIQMASGQPWMCRIGKKPKTADVPLLYLSQEAFRPGDKHRGDNLFPEQEKQIQTQKQQRQQQKQTSGNGNAQQQKQSGNPQQAKQQKQQKQQKQPRQQSSVAEKNPVAEVKPSVEVVKSATEAIKPVAETVKPAAETTMSSPETAKSVQESKLMSDPKTAPVVVPTKEAPEVAAENPTDQNAAKPEKKSRGRGRRKPSAKNNAKADKTADTPSE